MGSKFINGDISHSGDITQSGNTRHMGDVDISGNLIVNDVAVATKNDVHDLNSIINSFRSQVSTYINNGTNGLEYSIVDGVAVFSGIGSANGTSISISSVYCGYKVTTIVEDVLSVSHVCDTMKAVHIPSTVTVIKARAFANCSVLTSIYLPKEPPILEDDSVFANVNPNLKFYYDSKTNLEAYRASERWAALEEIYGFKSSDSPWI